MRWRPNSVYPSLDQHRDAPADQPQPELYEAPYSPPSLGLALGLIRPLIQVLDLLADPCAKLRIAQAVFLQRLCNHGQLSIDLAE